MPAGGNDCDCQCGVSACTKWLIGSLQNEIATRLAYSANNINGPGGDHYYDGYNCRHFLETNYDQPSETLVIRSQRAPHRDCVERSIYGGHTYDYPAETCGTADYTDDGTTIELTSDDCCPGYTSSPPAGPPVGTPTTPVVTTVPCTRNAPGACRGRLTPPVENYSNPLAVKHVKLKSGWRVRIRLVTDSLISSRNAFANDYGIAGYWSPSWDGHIGWSPIAGIIPLSKPQFEAKKACQFLHFQQINGYFETWPYTDTPISPSTGGGPITNANIMEYEHRKPSVNGSMCVLDNGGSATDPPTDHPTAPLVDQRPSVFGNLISFSHLTPDGEDLFEADHVTPKAPFVRNGNFFVTQINSNPPFGPSIQPTTTGNIMPNWWQARFYKWPFRPLMKADDFAGGATSANWRQSLMSNPAYYQCQPDTDNPDITPRTAAPFSLFMVSVPPISRGYEWATGAGGARTGDPIMKRPTAPVDTARVTEELDMLTGLFDNLTVHEYTPPDYPDDGTIRPRVVTAANPYNISWTVGDPDALPQAGCSPPGVSDCEIVVDIPKSGMYSLFFHERASRLTVHGSTTVVTYNIEKNVDGVWQPVELLDLCKPSPTPDHTGFLWNNADSFYRPFKTMDILFMVNPYKLINRGKPYCTGSGQTHYAGNRNETNWTSIMGSANLTTRLAGAAYTNYFNSYPTAVQTNAPNIIYDNYRTETRGRFCCGYDVAWYPYVGSSCHVDRTLADNFYTNASGVLDPKDSGSLGSPTPAARRWSLAW